MAKNNDKGKLLEDIVASFHNDENLKVETRVWLKPLNDSNGELREIDVLLTTSISGYPIYIPIECKNYTRQINPNDINAFSGKLNELGLSTNHAIYVFINGYTPKAKKSAKKVGIKLLTVQGLTNDRLSKSIYRAIQSIVYVLPIFKSYEVSSSIPNVINNEHLVFYDKDKNYIGTVADIIYSIWKSNKISSNLGIHKFTIEIPADWFNLYNNELYGCFPINVELMFVGYVFSYYGNASRLLLIDDETQQVKKDNINLDFENSEKCTIKSFKCEEELNEFLNKRNELYKLDIKRLKLPKVRMVDLFYPLSKKVYNELQTFYNTPNRSKLEIEEFSQKIQEIEKNIFSIWN